MNKPRLWQCGEGGKGGEPPRRVFQCRIKLLECWTVIPEYQRGSGHGCRSLSNAVGQNLAPGKSAKHGESKSYSGIEMCTRNLAGDIDSHGYRQPPTQSNVRKSAVNGLPRILGGE